MISQMNREASRHLPIIAHLVWVWKEGPGSHLPPLLAINACHSPILIPKFKGSVLAGERIDTIDVSVEKLVWYSGKR